MRKHTVDNMCYISQGMGVRKVSSSNSDLQGHSRSLILVLFDRPEEACQKATFTMRQHGENN